MEGGTIWGHPHHYAIIFIEIRKSQRHNIFQSRKLGPPALVLARNASFMHHEHVSSFDTSLIPLSSHLRQFVRILGALRITIITTPWTSRRYPTMIIVTMFIISTTVVNRVQCHHIRLIMVNPLLHLTLTVAQTCSCRLFITHHMSRVVRGHEDDSFVCHEWRRADFESWRHEAIFWATDSMVPTPLTAPITSQPCLCMKTTFRDRTCTYMIYHMIYNTFASVQHMYHSMHLHHSTSSAAWQRWLWMLPTKPSTPLLAASESFMPSRNSLGISA